jgi:hypothetical protein
VLRFYVRTEIAFLVHTPLIIDHFRLILSQLNLPYVIVSDEPTLHEFPTITFNQAKQNRFILAVSVHFISGNSIKENAFRNFMFKVLNKIRGDKYSDCIQSRYLPLLIADKNIRLSYGLHLSDWDTGDWNRLYDYFLAHGPVDSEFFTAKFKKKAHQIGYPRYAKRNAASEESILAELNLSVGEKIILWMPTYGEYNSFDNVPGIVEIAEKYGRVIVRPHPLTIKNLPELVEKYQKKYPNVIIDQQETRDLSSLYRLADLLIVDYGGPVMSGVYLEKKMILINTESSGSDSNVLGSVALDARKELASFPSAQFSNLREIFEFAASGRDMPNVLKLKSRYFGNEPLDQDTSIDRACDAIQEIYSAEVLKRVNQIEECNRKKGVPE